MVQRTRCKAFVFAVFLLSLLLSLLTKPALGQDATAKILGQVTDSAGALIANASIVVTNTATGVQNKTSRTRMASTRCSSCRSEPIGFRQQ